MKGALWGMALAAAALVGIVAGEMVGSAANMAFGSVGALAVKTVIFFGLAAFIGATVFRP